MTLERIDALNELGFIWDNHENGWNVRYKELLEFIKKEGHTSVPTDYRQNPPLGTWVRMQRRQYKLWNEKNKYSMMTSERSALLNAVGFVWSLSHARRKEATGLMNRSLKEDWPEDGKEDDGELAKDYYDYKAIKK
jgi:hypothetical protein